ncbi:NAD(P)-dependent dehydrogenase (short-subunit alcohol dehydrogenase family) [Algoriphagus ratkowskyi]|uniref:Glucose 1-dehydrogenase n=1 Tax=Algoriphagus ratkowskyi TaxID=57028 RepID=A0A2W7RP41_9BACT|nr:glucose 1-dehydrogenase [Algoriphagus ratkowskyi]PZX60260.1 NAD(P)-dependent dehydrogenase (short-subunit alcohol dehydrogenase family) [Algoriphagus ratkowskyi]TXD78081.1 glucose 1-dehydrogenase [Algoriphagus ratkowskyi]
MRLQGKTAIITGATSGMGKAMAERFVSEGASVILSGRDELRGKELEKDLMQKGGKVIFVAGDVSEIAVNEKLVQEAVHHFGKLDIIVTNAGKLGLGSVTDISIEDWNETFNTNLNSVFYLSRYAIPEMQKNGKGVILATSSIAAVKSFPNHAAYCGSKAALVALVKEMALDYSPTIRVNTICPGPVDTPMIWDSAKAFDDPDTIVQQTANNTLMKRLGKPEDIASLALFLVSDEASWITGAAYTIDGGILVG